MERILCVLIGYICGLFQTSYLYGKAQGIDIRNYGSGNAGTTNALRTLGAKAGAITLLGDCFKCVIAVVIVHLIFGKSHPEMIRLLGLYAAAGTILGHNFPFYLNFKGGKGIAATAGLLLSFDLRLTLDCSYCVPCGIFPYPLCITGIFTGFSGICSRYHHHGTDRTVCGNESGKYL